MLRTSRRLVLTLFRFTPSKCFAYLHRTLGQIRELGKQAGVVLNPSTPLELIEYVLELCDLVLIMSVNPGFGGQSFIPTVLPKFASCAKCAMRRFLILGLRWMAV